MSDREEIKRGGHWRTRAGGAPPLPATGGGPTSRGIVRRAPRQISDTQHNLEIF
jgi:hypothetical protein